MKHLDKTKTVFLANFGLLIMAIVWGFGFIVTKDSIEAVTPMQIMVFRFTIGAIGLILIFHKRLKNIDRSALKQGIILGVLVFFSYGLQTVGIKYTSASNNAFLTTIYVIIMPWLVYFTTKQKPSRTTIIASVMTFIGVGLMSITSNFQINIGDILTVIGAVIFGFHMLQLSVYTQKTDPIILAILQLSVTAILSNITSFIIDPPMNLSLLWSTSKGAILYLGVVNTLFTFLLQTVCQKYTSPVSASLIMSLESVFAGFFSYFILGERLSTKALIGAALIFIAIVVAQLEIYQRAKADERALYRKEEIYVEN